MFVRSPNDVTPIGAFAYSLDGGDPRRFLLSPRAQNLETINVTPKALALQAAGPANWTAYYGPRNGPLRPFKKYVVDLALSGSTMLTLEGRYDRSSLVARDVNGGPARRIAGPENGMSYMQAAGPYVAMKDPKGRIIVLNWKTRRVSYRVHPQGGSYAIAADGRVVVAGGEFERVQTASPSDPHLRTIARVNAAPYSVAIAGTRIVFEQLLSRSTGRLVLLRPDGKRRALTPRIPLGGIGIAFDGHTLAFVSGKCIYAGSIPAKTPTEPPAPC